MSRLRETILRLALYAVGYDEEGRTISDPVFHAVTEGRQRGGFASCAELPQWILARIGYRGPALNRSEFNTYKVGEGISKLYQLRRDFEVGDLIEPGDLYIMGAAPDGGVTHGGVIFEVGPDYIVTLDYGQTSADPDEQPTAKGAALRVRDWDGEYFQSAYMGARRLDWLIKPEDLELTAPLETATAWARRLRLEPPSMDEVPSGFGGWVVAALALAGIGTAVYFASR